MENEKQMTKKIRYLSLFTGIGGFERGIETSKHNPYMECVGYSEVDKYATSIYERHYPNHTRLGDATKIQTEDLQDFDLLVGGFPCQAFSHAGKRLGFNDTRGTLFFEIARILRDKKPEYFLLENVRGLLSHDGGNTFTTMLQILADLGYDVQWQIYNSKNHGVAQNRERIYIAGFSRERERCPREILPLRGASTTVDARHREDTRSIVWCRDRTGQPLIRVDDKQAKKDNGLRDKEENRIYSEQGVHPAITIAHYPGVCVSKKIQKVGNISPSGHHNGDVYSTDGVSRTLCARDYKDPAKILIRNNTKKGYAEARDGDALQLAQTGQNGPRVMRQKIPTMTNGNNIGVITNQYHIRKLTPVECERLQGFPDNWTKYGVGDELISDTQRYKCCGNAVTVNVVRDIINDWNILEEKEDLE
jgi:DNA (cytosine-5)-methyltransferase 1